MKTELFARVSFSGKLSGDGECFQWSDISKEDKIKIVGEKQYEEDRELEEETLREYCQDTGSDFCPAIIERRLQTLSPDEVCNCLGLESGKKYKFTISAEEV
jgi:hypothetical protein